jgi:uncharacterized protein YdhG (YjbR/CyaY superfamily)
MKKKSKPPNTVEEYLARIPEPARTTLEKVRTTIRSVVPKETTEVISYGIPAFHYKRGLIAYAAFSDHCSLFPLGSSAIEQFKDELKPFRVAKGTLHFPLEKPFPAPLLKKIVKARIAQNEAKKPR